MRSYHSHLATLMGAKKGAVAPRPLFRSSAIFPVFQQPGITSRVIFLGYWLLKRRIGDITCIVSLRKQDGSLISRRDFPVNEAKTYEINLSEELVHGELPPDIDFTGSIEVEFYSGLPLVFPYAAVCINYHGPKFSGIVHTAQRVYNDFDDMQKNSQTTVPESGFNIHVDNDKEPFLSFINGPEAVDHFSIEFEFYNYRHEVLKYKMEVGELKPYETKVIFPAREFPLATFLDGKVGAGKARFHLPWVFPRLVVGNFQHSVPAITITHTYYDCSKADDESDYWYPSEPAWHPASLMLPLAIADSSFTNIYFYPIYSPSEISLSIEIYDSKGVLLGGQKDALQITSPTNDTASIALKDLCQRLKIPVSRDLALRVIAHPINGSRLPARLKIAFDMGIKNDALPCNICTNLQPFNPPLETKPKTFRWGAVLSDLPGAQLWIMNSTPHVEYHKTDPVELTFYRKKDTESLKRTLNIPPNGFVVIRPDEDEELKQFLEGTVGWYTAITENPYSTTYFLSTAPGGVVGGDHGF